MEWTKGDPVSADMATFHRKVHAAETSPAPLPEREHVTIGQGLGDSVFDWPELCPELEVDRQEEGVSL